EPEFYPQFGIDSAGNERGVWNQPNLVTISAHSPNLKDILTHLRVHTKSVFKNAVQNLSMSFGSPPLIVFVIIGLFAKPWGRSLAICHLHIFPILALAVFATYFIYYSSARFYVLFVPFFCIWAVVGLQRLVCWMADTGQALGLSKKYGSFLRALVLVAGISFVFAAAGAPAGKLFAEARADGMSKLAGEWIRARSTVRPKILGSSTIVSFHADASHFWLPCCAEKDALIYIAKRQIDYVVLYKHDAQ